MFACAGKRKRPSYIDDDGDFDLPGCWEKFDVHEKRDLVRDLFAWHGKEIFSFFLQKCTFYDLRFELTTHDFKFEK